MMADILKQTAQYIAAGRSWSEDRCQLVSTVSEGGGGDIVRTRSFPEELSVMKGGRGGGGRKQNQ